MSKPYEERVFVNPADRLIAELDGTYYKLSEVAAALKISESTLRRLKAKNVLVAPSHQITRGGMRVYLYTREDVEEIAAYYKKSMEKRDGRAKSTDQSGQRHRSPSDHRGRPHGDEHQPRDED